MSKARNQSFRPDIEGLRAIAVIEVVAFHCGLPLFRSGFIGVDVFFVLSGYLITGLLVAEKSAAGSISLIDFYARRIRRLLPASTLTLLATLAAAVPILAPQELEFASRAARATALYLANMFFADNAADYFAANARTNPLLHTWSLAVEEQFYLIWPALIGLVMRLRGSPWHRLAPLGAVTVVSLVASIWLTRHSPEFAFYGLPTRAWEFGVGGLASMWRIESSRSSSAWSLTGWLGLGLLLASGDLISPAWGFPGWPAVLPVVGTVAVLLAGAQAGAAGPWRVLALRPLQVVGRLSYSWYLWHWPCLVLAAALLPGLVPPARAAVALASLGIAAISFHRIERPVRFHPLLLRHVRLTLLLGAALTAISLLAAVYCLHLAHALQNSPRMRPLATAVTDIAAMPREDCVALGTSTDVKSCAFGAQESPTVIVLFGDSHAIQWFNALERIATDHRWRLVTYLKSGCPATDIRPTTHGAGFGENCTAWRAGAIDRINALHPAAVVVGNSSDYVAAPGAADERIGVPLAEWRAGTRRTLLAMAASGSRVLLMRDTPHPPYDVPTCLARSLRQGWRESPSCDFPAADALRAEVADAESAAASDLADVAIVDMTAFLCHAGTCQATGAGAPAYRDDNHLTGSFAATLAPVLDARLLQALETKH
jgi:peptidoglycan/LPS O-acetylase OafA/YrhL